MAQKLNNAGSGLSYLPIAWHAFVNSCSRLARWRLPKTLCAFHYEAAGVVFFFIVFALSPPAVAQVSKEYQLKAVFLWRLAQFTEWPGNAFESADSPIVLCVLGENPFGDSLAAAVRGETAHGRNFVVQYYRTVDEIKKCHIVYISESAARRRKEIAGAISGRSILTVTDSDEAARFYDGMIEFVTEQNRIKLRINLKAITAARLVLDPRLLRAAEIIG